MNNELKESFTRTVELVRDLAGEYENSVGSNVVPPRIQQLTHEIPVKLRHILDRSAHIYWGQKIVPDLRQDKTKTKVYFPIEKKMRSFKSKLVMWGCKDFSTVHKGLYQYLLELQPFTNPQNQWLAILREIYNASHCDLYIPDKEERQHIILLGKDISDYPWPHKESPYRIISRFRVPIPENAVIPAKFAEIKSVTETEVYYWIKEFKVDALNFCTDAFNKTEAIVNHLYDGFSLT